MDSSSTTTKKLPVSAIHSYHSMERHLYARMVLALGMDSNLCMEVIAFWLWLEERGQIDVIHRVNSLDDGTLQAITIVGQTFVEALRFDVPPDHPSHHFHREAVGGIIYYLNHVCHQVLGDIRWKAEHDAKLRDHMEMLVYKMSQTSLNQGTNIPNSAVLRSHPNVQPYIPHGEGSSRDVREKRVNNIPSIMEVERQILSGYPFNLLMSGMVRPFPQYYGGRNADSIMDSGDHQDQPNHVPQDNIPREERTLFVTFSNGYPLTEEELHSFFMRNYGDVEAVKLQKPKGSKPPLFAHVSFYSLATVHRVLNGNQKVKFMTGGKHLWARRFYPKRNKEHKDK
ncbi:uncharacterized protein A4U43_C04F19330 [Asparagus officinalis]|uniref:RRM domain-containing protein n=2 Tax=Asparagus officinalis TaxID=4686 RepID=A0A5P1F244_ASPOF|nr:uncharacterized protein A4U43_C04F19330 [Asparagus officinalis]